MNVSGWVRGLWVLGCLASLPIPSGAQDDALDARTPEELAEACARTEQAVAAQPEDRKAVAQLVRLYTLAGVTPLLSEPPLGAAPGRFQRLEDASIGGSPARCYREGEAGGLFFVLLNGSRYRSYFRTDGKTLVAKVSGFGPLRSLALLDAVDPVTVAKAAEKALPDLRMLEEIGTAIRKAEGTEAESESLTQAADRLSSALRSDPARLSLLEELAHVYDRLGEVALGTSREPEYRRLQLAVAARLAEVLPDAVTTRRSLALAYFRLGAYPLAAQEASRAKDEPLAQDLALVLRAWSLAEHEKLESFDVDGSFVVDFFRTKAPPPESGDLFPELTFVVRRPKRPEFGVYTLSSQKLKSRRHYYIYFSYLGQRTLLTTYADRRPEDGAVKEKVTALIRKLAEDPKKGK